MNYPENVGFYVFHKKGRRIQNVIEMTDVIKENSLMMSWSWVGNPALCVYYYSFLVYSVLYLFLGFESCV